MEKKYIANLEYNIKKKRNSLILCGLLLITMLGMISIFVAFKNYYIIAFFGVFLILPFAILPSIFKTYPTDNRTILTVTDKTVTVGKETYKLKDVTKFRVIITLPYSHIKSENEAALREARDNKPEDIYHGNLDLVVKDARGKAKVLYTGIDHVIDATETLIFVGVKHYTLNFSIKKQTVECAYDLKKDAMFKMAGERKQDAKPLTEKEKRKQLL